MHHIGTEISFVMKLKSISIPKQLVTNSFTFIVGFSTSVKPSQHSLDNCGPKELVII